MLAVNQSFDALPFVRPDTTPTVLTGGPRSARVHKVGIPPGGNRWASYRVKGSHLSGRGPYRVDVALMAGMVPVNLVHAIKGVGFDFGMSASDVADAIVAGHRVLWERSVVTDASGG